MSKFKDGDTVVCIRNSCGVAKHPTLDRLLEPGDEVVCDCIEESTSRKFRSAYNIPSTITHMIWYVKKGYKDPYDAHQSGYCFLFVEDAIPLSEKEAWLKSQIKICQCDIMTLMTYGCRCGGK